VPPSSYSFGLVLVTFGVLAAIANFLMLRPKPALAIRHCIGSTLSTLNGTTKPQARRSTPENYRCSPCIYCRRRRR
jgi:hypothetical protein